MLKDQLFKTSGLQFDNWLFGPKSSRDFRETGSWSSWSGKDKGNRSHIVHDFKEKKSAKLDTAGSGLSYSRL